MGWCRFDGYRTDGDGDWLSSMTTHADRDLRTQPTAPVPGSGRGVARYLPGLAVCAAATVVAVLVNRIWPVVSPLLVAIALGAVLTNVITVPTGWQPGIQVAAKKLLRIGIVLLGLQLSLGQVAGLGPGMILVVVAIVGLGILATVGIGRLLRLPLTQTLLIACGFSICGAAAVAAVDGVMETDEEEVATAVGLVVLFGSLMIVLVPLGASALQLGDPRAALWAGGSIHEVAQVVAAAGALGPGAVDQAVLVKLARVLMLAPVMAAMALLVRRHPGLSHAGGAGKRPPLVPLFVLGFIAMMLLASTGLVPAPVLTAASWAQTALLAAAMFALGLGVRLKALVRVGPRPLLLGVLSTITVAGIALGGVLLVSPA
ncbi:putative integral membrane protein (TIGR00698 family) [Enemella evansiae]|nr:putative integral membrane protein (TIGR00698 family) [Enemella evansiae]